MPKEKNKPLNPYYLELLKYLVVYKLKNRLGLDLSAEERNNLAKELNEYNTKDSLNRIFSQGEKRRQNFNKSNLQGLCSYISYTDWDEFINKEYREWACELDEKLYADLSLEIKKKINKAIFIRILQEVEGKIVNGITEYFETYIIKENEQLNAALVESKLQATMRTFNMCVDYIAENKDEAHLIVIYKIAENIDENRYFFEGFDLPEIFKKELNKRILKEEHHTVIERLIEDVENPLNKEVMRLYKDDNDDENIKIYLNYQGIDIDIENIKLIRWQTADSIFNQLKTKEDGRKLLQD